MRASHKLILCLQSPGGVRSQSTATLKQNRLNLTLFIDLCHSNLFHIILLFFVIYWSWLLCRWCLYMCQCLSAWMYLCFKHNMIQSFNTLMVIMIKTDANADMNRSGLNSWWKLADCWWGLATVQISSKYILCNPPPPSLHPLQPR